MSLSTHFIALNSKTAGKDKIYRTVQYGCKLIWYILWRCKSNKDYIEILKKLEAAMSGARKVLRLGKTHDHIELILKSMQMDDFFLRNILTFSNVNQALYLLLDNILWLNSIGIISLKHKETQLNKYSNNFWFYSTIINLLRDLYDLKNVVQIEKLKSKGYSSTDRYVLNESSGAYTSYLYSNSGNLSTKKMIISFLRFARIICFNKRNHPLIIDTIKNLFDVFLPLSNLGYVNISPGIQGFFGLISSLLSILVLWDSKYKLTP